MPMITDENGIQAFQDDSGRIWYPDYSGMQGGDASGSINYDLSKAQYYRLYPLPVIYTLADILPNIPLANRPVEGQHYLMMGGSGGYFRVYYSNGVFYDERVSVDINGNIFNSVGPYCTVTHNAPATVPIDVTNVKLVKMGDYPNTGISIPSYNYYYCPTGGGDSTDTSAPGVIIDLRTPEQRAEDIRKYNQATAPSGFDSFMEAATIGTLVAISGAAASSAISGAAFEGTAPLDGAVGAPAAPPALPAAIPDVTPAALSPAEQAAADQALSDIGAAPLSVAAPSAIPSMVSEVAPILQKGAAAVATIKAVVASVEGKKPLPAKPPGLVEVPPLAQTPQSQPSNVVPVVLAIAAFLFK